ncbi:MAG: twitching motility protein PilT [Lachnospiraceae bacterium]|nr:twitching motility protein PilT [Lachnospiraceae bacterium]MCR5337493.1 twitching motility protein PilT [Lachnospiraceae bacterium]
MVQLIVGNKGKGKTKHLLEKVNSQVQEVSGNIVYLDKSAKHMYELNNKVRLIDLSQYGIGSSDGFIGFLYGIISQDHDLQQMYLDNFLTLAKLADDADITPIVEQLEGMGERFGVDFILSVGQNETELAAGLKDKVIVSL